MSKEDSGSPRSDVPAGKVVLDTSALLSGRDLPYSASDMVIPPAVHDEIQPGGASYRRFTYLQSAGLTTQEPTTESRQAVHNAAQRTGDLPRLSHTDAEVLALAHTLQAPVLTDDYHMQNLAHTLHLEARPIAQRGIRKPRQHITQCTGCHQTYTTPPPGNECLTCGSPTQTRSQHPRRKR